MATGILGTVASSGTLTYTALLAAKLNVSSANISGTSGTTTINGIVAIALPSTGNANSSVTLYVGLGQTVTITNSVGVNSIVSVLEEF